ncbi:unnamed protein product, partial [Polarella glacialis]
VPAGPACSSVLKAPLRHRYFALRHGVSKANVAKLIISDPKVGTRRFGLTAAGRTAAAKSAKAFAAKATRRTLIVSSDFTRTRETARVFAGTLRALPVKGDSRRRCCPVRISPLLRERLFGTLEGGPNSRYEEVWAVDRRDPGARPFGAESAKAVVRRTAGLVARLDRDLPDDGSDVVLVSHGDALQLLQTAFQGIDASKHRSLPHLDPAELRELVLK